MTRCFVDVAAVAAVDNNVVVVVAIVSGVVAAVDVGVEEGDSGEQRR